MKRLALIALFPLAAWAAASGDYAKQWPLRIADADAGAYRVVLEESVYRQLQSPAVKDLEVVNAEGSTMAASLFDADVPMAQSPSLVEVPWFVLPAGQSAARDIASISEIANDGSLRRITLQPGAVDTTVQASGEYLIDTSRLRAPVQALRFTWNAGQAPFDHAYRISASDDLKNWRTVQVEGHLVDLQNGAERVLGDRIELDAVRARYLRLVPWPENHTPLSLAGVRAELPAAASDADWRWVELAGKRVQEQEGKVAYVYQAEGRFPFERADVVLPGNSSNEWALTSRDDAQAQWRPAATPWMAFQLSGGTGSRSAPQPLLRVIRDHQWRLLARNDSDGAAAPTLRLGYRPEVLVFLSQGKAPYSLVAGSARAQRADAPLQQMVDAMRAQRGGDWQPATATLGDMQVLAGEAALVPAPVQRDWKSWLLWALLVGGALIVAGFAFSLLKKPPQV